MSTVVYRPGHPLANDNGMVDQNLASYDHKRDAPFVISDTIDATRNMADNKMYTSKAKFRQATKAHGCIEVGNETATLLKPRKPIPMDRAKRVDDIRRSIYELKNGRR